MTADNLYELYVNNIDSIITPGLLGTIADRKYDIHGYNLINRILIYIQNKYTNSVKSESGWECIGRKVKDKASPIWILENVITTRYIDADTNEEADLSQLSQEELSKAIELGVIIKQQNATSLKTIPVYNIKDTEVTNRELYKSHLKAKSARVKFSDLLKLANSNYGIGYEKTGDKTSYFDSENNIIHIGSDSVSYRTQVICEAIFNQLNLEDTAQDIVTDYDSDSEYILRIVELCKTFFIKSIMSYCDDNYSVERSDFSDIDDLKNFEYATDIIVQLLTAVYDLVEDTIGSIAPSNIGFSETTLRKAVELLSILEANEAYNKFG